MPLASRRCPLRILLLLALVLVASVAVSLRFGSTPLSTAQVANALLGNGEWTERLVVVDIRLPRLLLCVLIGACLSVAGVLLQGLSRNELASPSTVGVNAGAGLGMMLLLVAHRATAVNHPWLLTAAAVAGAMLTMAFVFAVAYRRGRALPSRLLLVGIAVGHGASAAVLLLALRMDFVTYSYVVNWMSGSLAGGDWNSVRLLAPTALVLLLVAFSRSRALNVFSLGDAVAASLGARVERERLAALSLATMITSASVAVGGQISFLGLVGPHLARRLVGSNHAVLFPAAALCGASLLVVGDSLGREMFAPIEIPAGVFVGILGGAYFLYLLATSKW